MCKSLRVTSIQPNTAVLTHTVSSQIKSSWLKPPEEERFHNKSRGWVHKLTMFPCNKSVLPCSLLEDVIYTNHTRRAIETYSDLSGPWILNSLLWMGKCSPGLLEQGNKEEQKKPWSPPEPQHFHLAFDSRYFYPWLLILNKLMDAQNSNKSSAANKIKLS